MFHALCLGSSIAQQLAADQELKRIGQTSRGCFLQTTTAPVWTVFLSEETPRGPLTVNLPTGAITPIQQTSAQTIPLMQGILHFSNTIQLSLRDASRWQADPPTQPILPPVTRRKTITQTIQTILQRKAASDLTGILPDLLPLLFLPFHTPATEGPFTQKLNSFIACLQSSDTSLLPNRLAAFLGQGSGLTPSGDDFLLGFFLTLNRWGDHLHLAGSAHPLGQEIAEKARRQTTHLSANLIECAIQGEADQRLITALDGLMTTEKCDPACMDGLLYWGNSSGLDAFAGMVLASTSPLA